MQDKISVVLRWSHVDIPAVVLWLQVMFTYFYQVWLVSLVPTLHMPPVRNSLVNVV